MTDAPAPAPRVPATVVTDTTHWGSGMSYDYFPSRADLMIDEQFNEVLQRVRSPEHGSTTRDLVAPA